MLNETISGESYGQRMRREDTREQLQNTRKNALKHLGSKSAAPGENTYSSEIQTAAEKILPLISFQADRQEITLGWMVFKVWMEERKNNPRWNRAKLTVIFSWWNVSDEDGEVIMEGIPVIENESGISLVKESYKPNLFCWKSVSSDLAQKLNKTLWDFTRWPENYRSGGYSYY